MSTGTSKSPRLILPLLPSWYPYTCLCLTQMLPCWEPSCFGGRVFCGVQMILVSVKGSPRPFTMHLLFGAGVRKIRLLISFQPYYSEKPYHASKCNTTLHCKEIWVPHKESFLVIENFVLLIPVMHLFGQCHAGVVAHFELDNLKDVKFLCIALIDVSCHGHCVDSMLFSKKIKWQTFYNNISWNFLAGVFVIQDNSAALSDHGA